MTLKIAKQNWASLTQVWIERHGAIYTAGLLAGILERCTVNNYDLQDELLRQLENQATKQVDS
jgi:hypothetical protein